MGRAWIIPTTSTMHMWRTWHACHSNGTRQTLAGMIDCRNTSWSKSRSLQMSTWAEETTPFHFYSIRKQDSLRWITPCSHCGKPNHTVDRCWELNSKPDDLPGKAKWLKAAYAAVEKPTIPPEVFDKKQASSTLSKVPNEILEEFAQFYLSKRSRSDVSSSQETHSANAAGIFTPKSSKNLP